MKIARRTQNNTWTHPLSVRDHIYNQRLAATGLLLDTVIQSHLAPVRRITLT